MKLLIHEIAKECGVSAMTVSRALDSSREHLVSEEKRLRIRQFCEQRHYEPNYSARTLASGKTYSIGLVQPWLQSIPKSNTYGWMIKYLVEECRKFNYIISLLPVEADDKEAIDREIVKIFRTGRVDGFISMAEFIGKQALDEMADRQFPIVTFNMPSDVVQQIEDPRRVYINSRPAVEALFRHLRRQGHSRIAYIGRFRLESSRNRLYREFLADQEDALVPDNSQYPWNNGALTSYRLVFDQWKKLKNYSAITCFNDDCASGVCQALRDKGIIPGRDVAVTGFDDLENGQENPFLTTIHPAFQEAAEKCVQCLIRQIQRKNPDSIQAMEVRNRLVIRASSDFRYEPKRRPRVRRSGPNDR